MILRERASSPAIKALIVGVIVLLLLIPLTMLRGLVSERSMLREQAYARVAEGWGGRLITGGPLITLPTERVVTEGDKTRVERFDLHLLPSTLDVTVDIQLQEEPRYVGIYAVPVYLVRVRVTGQFDPVSLQPYLQRSGVEYLWSQAKLRLPVSDVRSIREVSIAQFAGGDVTFGPAAAGIHNGIETVIGAFSLQSGAPIPFVFETTLAGSQSFSLLPTGSTTSVAMTANWAHPSFQGAFLPVERTIEAAQFTARWQVLELNRSYRQAWMQYEVNESELLGSAFGVDLYQPVDIYQRGERAIKYALLFIAMTFLAFFAAEQVSGIAMHPIQYLLVGLALSIFYLLLIALSEHVAFALAYALAAAALVILLGVYIAGAQASRRRGAIVGATMTLVYGLLYVLVLSEDYALLLGAITLFATLAAVMVVTRRINWYRASTPQEG